MKAIQSMDQIIIADMTTPITTIFDLFYEYLLWGTSRVNQDYGLGFSAEETISQDKTSLDKFMPLKGRTLLAYVEDKPTGVACLKQLTSDIGEVKRMYVRPQYRGRGIGKALLARLIEEAIAIGYTNLRLDSAKFMTEAHHLYHSMGFVDIEPYEGSEIQKEYQPYWVFMEKKLIS